MRWIMHIQAAVGGVRAVHKGFDLLLLRVYLKTQNAQKVLKGQEKDIKGFYHRQYKEVIA